MQDHVAEYKESKKLKPENGGSVQKLSIEHSNKLVAHLRNHTYLYVKDIVYLFGTRFFRKIETVYPGKKRIHVFCDNARYYKNKAVTEHLRASKIKLHFLPSYSPNLNPIERLWKWMKERVIYNT